MPSPPTFRTVLRRRRPWSGASTAGAIGGLPVAPVLIPYAWIATGTGWWPERPLTSATITRTAGSPADLSDTLSRAEYGDLNYPYTLDSVLAADPGNLAAWILTYYATQPGAVPRQRFLSLPLVALNARTAAEQQLILSVQIGRRIRITNPPATWPTGLSEQVVEGIAHSWDTNARTVTWRTLPVVGSVNGTAGPWFRLDSSVLDGTDLMPF